MWHCDGYNRRNVTARRLRPGPSGSGLAADGTVEAGVISMASAAVYERGARNAREPRCPHCPGAAVPA